MITPATAETIPWQDHLRDNPQGGVNDEDAVFLAACSDSYGDDGFVFRAERSVRLMYPVAEPT
ncbi:hypothetical protein GCM10010277_80460 [Streptomyces longisporoflavus]|nr:hypothetical protein GCM10010277_80460 [Streptomyces longisporoflavus]